MQLYSKIIKLVKFRNILFYLENVKLVVFASDVCFSLRNFKISHTCIRGIVCLNQNCKISYIYSEIIKLVKFKL